MLGASFWGAVFVFAEPGGKCLTKLKHSNPRTTREGRHCYYPHCLSSETGPENKQQQKEPRAGSRQLDSTAGLMQLALGQGLLCCNFVTTLSNLFICKVQVL